MRHLGSFMHIGDPCLGKSKTILRFQNQTGTRVFIPPSIPGTAERSKSKCVLKQCIEKLSTVLRHTWPTKTIRRSVDAVEALNGYDNFSPVLGVLRNQ